MVGSAVLAIVCGVCEIFVDNRLDKGWGEVVVEEPGAHGNVLASRKRVLRFIRTL